MKSYAIRTVRLIAGIFLYALGIFLSKQANIGLPPWDAFGMGFALLTGIPFGTMTIIISFVVIALDLLLKEKIGWGTVLNGLLIGAFINLFDSLGIVPQMENFGFGVLMMLLGQTIVSYASYLYISPGMGCGPRDGLMVAIGKRLPKVPIGIVRILLEGTVLLVGWLLGAKVGLGTIISVLGLGLLMQLVFKLLHFEVRTVEHENIFDTMRNLRALIKK